jgi:hypothetical protein
LTGPARASVASAWRIAPVRSSSEIQLHHWRPEPTGPPRPQRKGGRSAGRARQDHADPEGHDAHAAARGGLGGHFPLAAHVGEEARAGRALLAQDLVAAVAVVAGRGGGHEHARRAGELRERLGEEARRARAARADAPLLLRCPPPARDALAREVHDGIQADEAGRVDRARDRVPADGALARGERRGRRAHEADDPVAGAREARQQRRADETRGARDRDGHRHRA